jgi:hypothetical protein
MHAVLTFNLSLKMMNDFVLTDWLKDGHVHLRNFSIATG